MQKTCQSLLEFLLVLPFALMFLADVICERIVEEKKFRIFMTFKKHINFDKRFFSLKVKGIKM